jgi:hypothetical protein
MNKGVELLRARRETHIHEFVPQLDRFELMRWSGLFRDYKVNLNDARTYPTGKKGKSFTEAVMSELLQGEHDPMRQVSKDYTKELAKAMQETKKAMLAHLRWSMYENK